MGQEKKESTWEKLKAIPKALEVAAGKTPSPPPTGKPSAPTWPDNTIIHVSPKGQKDMNLPLKGSVLDPDRTVMAKKITTRRRVSRGPALSRRV